MRRTFVRLSEASLQTPSRLYISGVRLTDRQAFKFGSYGAIYKGEYGEHVVALKSLFKQLDPKQNKVLLSPDKTWVFAAHAIYL